MSGLCRGAAFIEMQFKYRHHKRRYRKTDARYIPDRVSNHARPPEADGKRFGDWEMDLIIGKEQKSAILTLCDRSVNYLIMMPLPGKGKNPREVALAAIEALLPYKRYVKTITTDNGLEFTAHKIIAKKPDTTVYFADSYASWQKGAIENANKLIRQYIPKGTDFRTMSEQYIKNIQYKLNERPRKKLNFSNPKTEFFNLLL